MTTRGDKSKTAILKALHDINGPAGASHIATQLLLMGMPLHPRTIRFYLLQLDENGFTRLVSKRQGRGMTERGREELARANVLGKIGFVAAKIDALGYRMSFTNQKGEGTVVTNSALINRTDLARALMVMAPVFAGHFGMGTKLALSHAGDALGNTVVPEGSVAVHTVCSVTVNGIMLHESVPVVSRFGGLVEMQSGKPVRFVELIEYRGTTVDPLEVFIRANMTRVQECARNGTGIIGASFREIPSVAVADVHRIQKNMESHGLGGILAVGMPNQPLHDIPVAEGRSGMIVAGGLNPIAAMHEAGIQTSIRSLSYLRDFREFHTVEEAQQSVK